MKTLSVVILSPVGWTWCGQERCDERHPQSRRGQKPDQAFPGDALRHHSTPGRDGARRGRHLLLHRTRRDARAGRRERMRQVHARADVDGTRGINRWNDHL